MPRRITDGRRLPVVLGMLLVLALFTFPLWSTSRIIYQGDIVNSDVTEYHFPVRYLLSRELKQGDLPVYTSLIGCGFPLLAEGQSGLLYPLNLFLFYAFSPILAFNLTIILSLLMCLAFSYLLFRVYDISPFSSFFSAVAFTFSGYVVARLKFTYMVNCICWIPLAVYGVEKSFRRKNFAHIFLTSLALAMQLLAGGPQFFMITLLLTGIAFLWRLASLLKTHAGNGNNIFLNKRLFALPLLLFVISLLVALGIASPQLLPMLKGYSVSDRSLSRSFEWSTGVPMQPRNLVMFVSPYRFGNPARDTYDLQQDLFWENIAYPGLLTLVLALLALLFTGKRDGFVSMWATAGTVAFLLSLGPYTPLAEFVWRYIPGFGYFRFWQRFLVIVVLALAALAGRGLDILLSRPRGGRTWRMVIALLALLVLVTDLGFFFRNQVSTIDARRMLQENDVAAWLRERLDDTGGGPYRMEMVGAEELWEETMAQAGGWLGDKDAFLAYQRFLPPNHNILFGLPSFTQYGDYGIYRFKMLDGAAFYLYAKGSGWTGELTRTGVNIMALYGVRYVLSPLELSTEGLHEVERRDSGIDGATLHVYEVEDPLPAARMAQDHLVIDTEEAVGYSMVVDLFWDAAKARGRVVLEKEPSVRFGPEPAGTADIVSKDDGHATINANTPGGGILILNDTYYPEWHVYVDGEEREVLRVNLAAMGVELEPGEHVVEFIYKPSSLHQGLLVCAATLLLLLLLFLENRRKRFCDLNPQGGLAEAVVPDHVRGGCTR
ncbi:MAG: YfhO family protein [Actinobacteria bacterium]|nr:YfhO family protein [Actinomycetota bacterium]